MYAGNKIRANDGPSASTLIGWTLTWLNFELTYLEVDASLQLAHVDPAIPSVILYVKNKITTIIMFQPMIA